MRRLLSIIAPMCVIAILLSACSQQRTAASAVAAVPTPSRPVFDVIRGPITNVLQGSGRVVAQQQQELYFRQGGNLYAINVHLNDHVKAGQVLATLNTQVLKRQIQQAKAAVDAAKLNLEKTQVQVASGESPSNISGQQPPIVSAQDVKAAVAQADSAKAVLDATESALNLLTHPLSDVIAPLQSSLAQARDGLLAAKAQLAQEQAGPTIPTQQAADAAVAQAQAQLRVAEQKLTAIEAGPNPLTLEAARASLELATAEYDAAKAAYQAFQNGPTPATQEQASVAVQQAKDQLFAAQVLRDSICGQSKASSAQCQVANANVAVAETNLQGSQIAQATLGQHTPQAVTQAQAAFQEARASYTFAKLQYQEIVNGPVQVSNQPGLSTSSQADNRVDQLLRARLAVKSAQAALQAAEAQRQALSTATPATIAKSQAAVAAANSQVAAAQASLEAIVHPSPSLIAQAEQAVAQAKAQFIVAKAKASELEQLQLAGNTAQLAIAIAQNAVTQAELNLETLQGQEADMQIVAPFNGVVTYIQGQPGKFIGAFQPIITIANPKTLLVAIDLTNQQLGQVAIGQKVNMTMDAFPGQNIEGTITALPSSAIAASSQDVNSPGYISTTASQQQANANGIDSQSVVITPKWPNTANISLGSTVNVTITGVTEQNTILVPTQAVTTVNNRSFVLLDIAGHEVPQKVVLGIQNSQYTEILAGLQVGQKVFAAPQ